MKVIDELFYQYLILLYTHRTTQSGALQGARETPSGRWRVQARRDDTRTTHAHARGRSGDQPGRRLAGSMASSPSPDSCGCGAASEVDLAAPAAVRALAGRAAAGDGQCGRGRRSEPFAESRPQRRAIR